MFAVRNLLKVAVQNFTKKSNSLQLINSSNVGVSGSLKLFRSTIINTGRVLSSIAHSAHAAGKSAIYSRPCGILTIRPEFLTKTNDVEVHQQRTVTKYSITKGKRRTVKAVLKRFYRLDWGIWIRTKCGRNKKLYKKSNARKRRLKEHVFCNASQSYLLDKMVNRFWKIPKYYIDDPYEPYHRREEFGITRKTPKPPTVQ